MNVHRRTLFAEYGSPFQEASSRNPASSLLDGYLRFSHSSETSRTESSLSNTPKRSLQNGQTSCQVVGSSSGRILAFRSSPGTTKPVQFRFGQTAPLMLAHMRHFFL